MAKIVSLSGHLSAKQREVVLLIAQGISYKSISETTGVAVQTLYNWRSANPAFRRELVRLQEQLYEEGIRALHGLVHEATSTLGSVMTNPDARDSDRIAAARAVLQFATGSGPEERSGEALDEEEFGNLAQQVIEIVRLGSGS